MIFLSHLCALEWLQSRDWLLFHLPWPGHRCMKWCSCTRNPVGCQSLGNSCTMCWVCVIHPWGGNSTGISLHFLCVYLLYTALFESMLGNSVVRVLCWKIHNIYVSTGNDKSPDNQKVAIQMVQWYGGCRVRGVVLFKINLGSWHPFSYGKQMRSQFLWVLASNLLAMALQAVRCLTGIWASGPVASEHVTSGSWEVSLALHSFTTLPGSKKQKPTPVLWKAWFMSLDCLGGVYFWQDAYPSCMPLVCFHPTAELLVLP